MSAECGFDRDAALKVATTTRFTAAMSLIVIQSWAGWAVSGLVSKVKQEFAVCERFKDVWI